MIVSSIKVANNSRQVTGAVFFDIEGAFDNVVPDTLLAMLPSFGIPPKMLAFLASVVSFRRLKGFASGTYVQTRNTSRGLLQGSILSPILFNIYVSLVESCLFTDVKALIYADDIVIFCSNSSVSVVAQKLNTALDRVQFHLTSLGLRVSPSKSVATFYSLYPLRNMKWLIKKKGVNVHISGVKLNIEWTILIQGSLHVRLKIHNSISATSSETAASLGCSSPTGLELINYERVVIVSDSFSVISCSGSTDPKGAHSPLIYQIKELVLEPKSAGVSVVLMWVPRHCTISGNEKAD
ncbi:uncharacterized protein LOC109862182, partial [Pseudomyrmex gracilis]|uniref:uncharacterized protein LOC109862182 n=1 Tax=Pseudomyrmex gracilis TaxID=219809 RepID=UPI000994FA3E